MPFIQEKALEILITQIILVTSNAYKASFKVPANLTAYQYTSVPYLVRQAEVFSALSPDTWYVDVYVCMYIRLS